MYFILLYNYYEIFVPTSLRFLYLLCFPPDRFVYKNQQRNVTFGKMTSSFSFVITVGIVFRSIAVNGFPASLEEQEPNGVSEIGKSLFCFHQCTSSLVTSPGESITNSTNMIQVFIRQQTDKNCTGAVLFTGAVHRFCSQVPCTVPCTGSVHRCHAQVLCTGSVHRCDT